MQNVHWERTRILSSGEEARRRFGLENEGVEGKSRTVGGEESRLRKTSSGIRKSTKKRGRKKSYKLKETFWNKGGDQQRKKGVRRHKQR